MNITIAADTLNSYNCKNHYLTNEYSDRAKDHLPGMPFRATRGDKIKNTKPTEDI